MAHLTFRNCRLSNRNPKHPVTFFVTLCLWAVSGATTIAFPATAATFDHIYDVGPGQALADPSQVPWESLQPGTLVRIHYRNDPYATKWVIATTGTAAKPVVVRGVADAGGNLPVITGENAVTRLELDYWNENRSVVKIGGSSHPSDWPAYITIENLEIRSAHPGYTYTDDRGNGDTYSSNAASIHAEEGDHITIRNCILTDSGNGFFAGHTVSDIVLEGNYIHGNGIVGSWYEHNNYTECMNITFQYNRFGLLRNGALGNNLKDRSAGTVVRYNWIESGNRALDLVDSGHAEFYNHPGYRDTYVYGNVLIEDSLQSNNQVIHYGGDSGNASRYRKGTLWLYHNTVISYRSGNTTLVRLSSSDESVEAFNNVVYPTADGSFLAIMGTNGQVHLHHNWLPSNYRAAHGSLAGTLDDHDNLTGTDPLFSNFAAQDFLPTASSPCRDAGLPWSQISLGSRAPYLQYSKHQQTAERVYDNRPDLGAFARTPLTICADDAGDCSFHPDCQGTCHTTIAAAIDDARTQAQAPPAASLIVRIAGGSYSAPAASDVIDGNIITIFSHQSVNLDP